MSLVRWYPLNGNCNDKLNSINNGTPTNITYSNGKVTAQSILLDSTSKVIFPSVNLTSFSVSCWVKPTETQVGLYPDPWVMSSALLRFEPNGDINFWVYNGNWKAITYNYSLNTWYHIVCIYDHKNLNMYLCVNGEKTVNTITSSWDFSGRDAIFGMGNYANIDEKFIGNVNDLRVYDHVISDKEIYNLSKGLVANYTLNGTYSDSICNGPTLINAGTGTVVSSTNSAISPNSCYFDGTCSLSTVSYNYLWGSTGTITCWVNPDTIQPSASGAYAGIVSLVGQNGIGSGFLLSINSNNLTLTMATWSNDFYSNLALIPGIWNFIAVKLDGPTVTIYLNDQKQSGTLSSSVPANINTNALSIGCTDYISRYYKGYISDVKIFTTSLSDSDISNIYHSRGSIDHVGNLHISENVEDTNLTNISITNRSICKNSICEIGPTSGLVGYWPFKNDLKDYSGYNNHLTPSIGSVIFDRNFGNRSCLHLNDTTDLNANVSNLSFTDFSMACWVNLDNPTIGVAQMFFNIISDGHWWRLFMEADLKSQFDYIIGSGNELGNVIGSAVPAASFVFLVGTFTSASNTFNLYQNGVLQNSISQSSSSTANISTINVGVTAYSHYMIGSFANYRLYNRVLTTQEINILYDIENPNTKQNMKLNNGKIYLKSELKETFI